MTRTPAEVLEQLQSEAALLVAEAVEHTPDAVITDFAIIIAVQGSDGGEGISFACSDHRHWVQAGLFRNAMLNADGGCSADYGEEAEEDDEAESQASAG